jgi:CDP-glycerol glycerophosphotransferase (TagB/SpsB family)
MGCGPTFTGACDARAEVAHDPGAMSLLEYRVTSVLLRALGALFSLLPVSPERVVLASPRHAHLEGNLAFVEAALRRRRPGLRPIVLVERYGYGLLDKVAYLLRAIRGMYFLRTARVFVVDNAYLPVHVAPHRASTFVIQVWHAASAVKRFGIDTVVPPAEPERTFLHRYYDAVLVSSEAVRGLYSRSLRTPIEHVLALGVPRTDLFSDPTALAGARAHVLARHPQLAGRTVVLYAPTLRGRGASKRSTGALDPVRLRELLPETHVVVFKGHPNVALEGVPVQGFDVVVDPGEDMNELLALADILVTDYSSAVFEFALLRRPIVYLIGDLEEYARDPGVAVDFASEMVGAEAVDTEGVARAILAAEVDPVAYDAFIARHVGACDGRASERAADLILSRIGGPQSPRAA